MQLHSSLVPIALIGSTIAGVVSYNMAVGGGATPEDALTTAKWVAGILNVVIGVPKNLIMLDFVSLLLARPTSLVAVVAGLVPAFTG